MRRAIVLVLLPALVLLAVALVGGCGGASDEAASGAAGAATASVNLVFIHHSCGENWLNDGLCRALNDDGYHVADISYTWTGGTDTAYGDSTDTVHWPTWFTDEVMELVYEEMDAMTAPNTLDPSPGENTVVMFKSCYPNSEVGSDITDEQALYNSLLPYIEKHPDKMFVLVTPPPMRDISHPEKTRELCDWLVREWPLGISTGNLFVFDLYNVLTDPEAHHRCEEGVESHVSVEGRDTLYYDSNGDDHPSREGNLKATQEFVGLLDLWYGYFLAAQD